MNESPEDAKAPENAPEPEAPEPPEATEEAVVAAAEDAVVAAAEEVVAEEEAVVEAAAGEIVAGASEVADEVAVEVFAAALEEGLVEAAVDGEVTEAEVDRAVDEAAAVAEEAGGEAFETVIDAAVEAIEVVEPVPTVAEAEPLPPIEEEVELETVVRDPFKGLGEWYVVHTYAGYENKVKTNLESRIHTMQMEEKIFDVHIPMEDVMEIKGGKKQVVQRKVFPGYLLVKMIYDNDSWYVVRNTPGVTGFVAAGTGSKPTPLSRREVEKILAVKKQEVKPTFRLGFEEGDVVRIIEGPFADFNGTISEINLDQSKLKVLVNIFDRETPVELGFHQVAKV